MNKEREKLIEEINKAMFRDEDKGCVKPSEIAEFIISDRKRICEPFTKLEYEPVKNLTAIGLLEVQMIAIKEVLNRAGLGDGK